MVHTVDAHSNKSALMPPPLIELDRFAQRARSMLPDTTSTKVCGGAMRSLRRRLARQTIEELVTRYNAGESTPALSREYGISKTGLRALLQAEGVPMRKQAITPEDTLRAVRLYESGLTITQVVERVGYSYGTIRKALHEHGVAMRATGIGKSATPDQRP